MKTEQILMCVVALILGMLLANMLKNVCGCKVVEGNIRDCDHGRSIQPGSEDDPCQDLWAEGNMWGWFHCHENHAQGMGRLNCPPPPPSDGGGFMRALRAGRNGFNNNNNS